MQPTCTHIAIHAHDVGRSVAFYTRYAGLCEVHRRSEDGVTVVWLGEEARERQFVIVILGLPHEDAVNPGPMAHIGYAVASRAEVDRLGELADADGILVEPPRDAGPIVGYFCIAEDPDGNWVEFSYGQSLGPLATSA
jgi:catechol 2,3-dioxygenase-like lactoylglutathione lyase family enzyme